jgi:transcriptional regulator with XRE-family HTH domain
MMEISELFGQVLREFRKKKGFSQEYLAGVCNLDRTYISLLERGLRQPTLKTVFALSNALGISPTMMIKKVELIKKNEVKST